ncbi:MAG: Gfo/Idh/MocA family oxidoreductase [Caldilineaceae bacterium]
MVRPVRIGVIGCGSVMRDGYMPIAQQLRAEGVAEVVMACDVNASLAATIQEQFAIPRFTTDYQEVLVAEDVDLVLVLTAPPTHGAIAHTALRAGKHVLLEKPMALDLASAATLVALAEQSPGMLLPAPISSSAQPINRSVATACRRHWHSLFRPWDLWSRGSVVGTVVLSSAWWWSPF